MDRKVTLMVPNLFGTGHHQVPDNNKHARLPGMGSNAHVCARSWRR